MTRYGQPIQDYPMSGENSIQTGIGFGLLMEEFDAAIKAGLDLERWFEGEYSVRFKAYVVAYHRLTRLIAGHTSEAEAKHMKNARKGKG